MYRSHSQVSNHICIQSIQFPSITYDMALYYKRPYTAQTQANIVKIYICRAYMRARGASELRHFWHFYKLEVSAHPGHPRFVSLLFSTIPYVLQMCHMVLLKLGFVTQFFFDFQSLFNPYPAIFYQHPHFGGERAFFFIPGVPEKAEWRIFSTLRAETIIQCVPEKRKPINWVNFSENCNDLSEKVYIVTKFSLSSFFWHQLQDVLAMHEQARTISNGDVKNDLLRMGI